MCAVIPERYVLTGKSNRPLKKAASGAGAPLCERQRRWEVSGATHTAVPGLCPPETSQVP
jgi:hypothetical protein